MILTLNHAYHHVAITLLHIFFCVLPVKQFAKNACQQIVDCCVNSRDIRVDMAYSQKPSHISGGKLDGMMAVCWEKKTLQLQLRQFALVLLSEASKGE